MICTRNPAIVVWVRNAPIFPVMRDTDPADLAARTLAVIGTTNVMWERRRSSTRVVVQAAQIVAASRGDVHAAKLPDAVWLWSDATGRETSMPYPVRRKRAA